MVELTLLVPGWRAARPGEFAMVRLGGSARFLPRAFSVHAEPPSEAGESGARVAFLISPVGSGTGELMNAPVGSEVCVVGPLGRPFDLDALSSSGSATEDAPGGVLPRLLIVAGGVGAAPFLLVLDRLAERVGVSGAACPAEVLVLLGFRDSPQAAVLDVFEPALAALSRLGVRARMETICEDGSLGREGLVTDLLSAELRSGDALLCCGAHAMCEAVWDLCVPKAGVRAWFSLEAGMACGVGSCQGCVIPMADGRLVRVCREGPVFSGEEAFGGAVHPCAVGGDGS
jgi:dihydroorotate dehydrogenase electron transfer subunit